MKHLITLTFISAFLIGTAHAGLSDGLVAHYKFDGNANDSSIYNNHGAEFGGVSYVSGKLGQAASFDGVDDYIEIPKSESLDTRFSISIFAWVNSTGLEGPIVNYCAACFGVHLWELQISHLMSYLEEL